MSKMRNRLQSLIGDGLDLKIWVIEIAINGVQKNRKLKKT